MKSSTIFANCPTRKLLERISTKWTALVLYLLADRPYRFNELLHSIEGIS